VVPLWLAVIGPIATVATIAAAAGAVAWRIGRVERDVSELARRFDASSGDQGRRLGDHDTRIAVLEQQREVTGVRRRPTRGIQGGGSEG
jgi:hypothetical protein